MKFELEHNGKISEITLYDVGNSDTLVRVIPEILQQDFYHMKKIPFQPGDIVIDVGANIGTVSIVLAKMYPNIVIYSIEPCETNYKNLISNIEVNQITNIIPLNLAAAAESNEIITITLDPSCSGSSGSYRGPDGIANQCKTISFDDLVIRNKINKIKFMKIDCEGGEYGFLTMSRLFEEFPIEYMAIEIHRHMIRFGRSKHELLAILDKKFNASNLAMMEV